MGMVMLVPRAKRALEPGARQNEIEWDVLTTALNGLGIFHVAPFRRRRPAALSTRELYHRLFLAKDPRLQEASIVLLLTHPDTANDARAVIAELTGVARDRAMRRYMAAACLQRMWRTRLQLRLGPQVLIEGAYAAELELPDLSSEFGETALLRLAEQEEALYGYKAEAGYQSLMEMFLAHSELAHWGETSA